MEIPSVSATHGFARSIPAKLERLLDAEDNNNGLQLSKGEKKKIGLLKDQLKQICGSLMDPSEVEFPASAAKCWVVEVRELSYDIDDFHDELVSKCQAFQFQNNPHGSKHMKRPKKWISSEVSRFRTRLEKAIQRYKTYRLQESKMRQQSCITSFDDERPPPPLFGFEPIGIGDSVDKVENWLTDGGEPKRRVVAVVGLGGVGKTTLANKLYSNLRKRFQCHAFVRSSQMPDMRELLTSILLQVRPHMPPDVSESCNLTNTIRTHLQQKKYFIVIDGLWTLSTWDLILQALPDDDNCFSRILTTTEVDAVAHRCCGHNSNYMLRMEPLSKDGTRELFFSIFDSKQPEFSESEISSESTSFSNEISSEILSKCGGFPLAIVSISSLLANQPQGNMEKWKYVRSTLSSNLKTNPTVEGMKQVLSLCYNSLPDHLKTCMLYLSIYKQGHIIRKDDLVKQWIAEGFICAKQGKGIEEVASSYFDELVTKGMIQPVHNSHNGQVISCTVHYMILQLIQCKSIEENFVITIHHSETNIRLGDKVRRLSLHFGDTEDAKPADRLELSQIRTLAFYGVIGCMPSLAEFRLLRVIILDVWADKDHIKFEIPTFYKLGYLEIACNVKLMLQIKLHGLQYLETLKIDSRRSEVPQDIVDLPRLLHLSLPGDTNLPNCIGRMSSLRTFGCFNLSSNSADNVQSLDKLTDLRDLHLTCSTMLCDNLEENFGILSSVLPKLNNLKSLTLLPAENSSRANILGASSTDKNIPYDRLLTVSPPPGLLEKLELSPRICIFSSLPGWIGDLGNLSILKIAARELSQSEIETLNSLAALSALLLYVSIAPSKRIVLLEGFRVLKHFKFVCSTLCLAFEEGAMPSLRSLKLGFNANRSDHCSLAEAGFENLKRLSAFSAKIGCAGALEHGTLARSALEDALRSGARQPIINIHLVDRVFGCDEETSTVGRIDEAQTQEKADVIITGCGGPTKTYQTTDKNSSPAIEISQGAISCDDETSTVCRTDEAQTPEKADVIITGCGRPTETYQTGDKNSSSVIQISQDAISYDEKTSMVGRTDKARTLEKANVIITGCGGPTETYQTRDKNSSPAIEINRGAIRPALMAGAVLTVLSKIGNALEDEVIKFVIAEASKKVAILRELPESIRLIGYDLKMMNNVVQDLDTMNLSLNVAKEWITNVRNLAFRVEDVIDKYSYHAFKMQEEGSLMWLVKGTHNAKVFSDITDEVVHIKNEIERVKQRRRDYFPAVQVVQASSSEIVRQRYQGYNEDLVGIKSNKEKLIEWLHCNEPNSTVVTVSGMGGLGKTTLVMNVYERVKTEFPVHAWITVSQTYAIVSLLRELLRKIGKDAYKPSDIIESMDAYKLREEIKNVIGTSKCLFVLDDVWNVDVYHQLDDIFETSLANRIIITTRSEYVASLASSERRLQLQPLGSSDAFILFCSRAFNNRADRKCPAELQDVATSIVDRCKGLPLAIISMGSLMSSKKEQYWNQVYKQFQSEVPKSYDVQAILSLSYNDLPGDLRNCFLYCSLFPEDHIISRESLVRLWVAEGFAVTNGNNTPEEVAELNLEELVTRNLLQVQEYDELGRVDTCKMHDIVRDLALSIAKDEKFGSANHQGAMIQMNKEVRRLSLCGWNDSDVPTVRFSHLRTLFSLDGVMSTRMLASFFSGSSYLTVLELQDSEITEVPVSIGNLFNLHYIGLRRTGVKSLPECIEKLSNLQTLDIKQTKIEKLPRGIVKVKKLRHLLADRVVDEKQKDFQYFAGVQPPKYLSNLVELQTLETVEATNDLANQLDKLRKLRSVWIVKVSTMHSAELFATLSKLPLLSSLILNAIDEDKPLQLDALNPQSKQLRKLIVRGCWAAETLQCPIFKGHGKNLKYLALSWSGLQEDPLLLIAPHVPNLTYLSLNRVSSTVTMVIKEGSFPQLKTLVLKNMLNVNQLTVEKDALRNIEGLYIVGLPKLNKVPHGFESLLSLRKLWLLSLHKDFKTLWEQSGTPQKMPHVVEVRVQ